MRNALCLALKIKSFKIFATYSNSRVSLINDAKVRIKNYVAKEKRRLGVVLLRKVIKY